MNFYRTTFSLASIFAVRMLGLFMILPVFSVYAEQLNHATPTLIGVTLGIYGLTQACLQIPFGLLSDKFGRKPLIIIGLILFILGSIIAGLSTSIYGVLIGRALQGTGAIGSVILALLADLTPAEQRGRAMAVIGIVIALTFALSLILGPLFNAWIGMRGIFWLTAILGVIGIIILLAAVPQPQQLNIQADVEPIPRLIKSVLRNSALLRLNVGIFCLHAILTALFVILPSLLVNLLGMPEKDEWTLYLPVILLAFIVALPLIGIAEKRHRVPEFLLAGIVVIGISLLSFLFLPLTVTTLGIYLWLFFTAFTMLEALLPSLISKLAPPGSKGTALGVYSTLQFLGIFIGGSVAGELFQRHNFHIVFLFALVLSVIWLLVAARTSNFR